MPDDTITFRTSSQLKTLLRKRHPSKGQMSKVLNALLQSYLSGEIKSLVLRETLSIGNQTNLGIRT